MKNKSLLVKTGIAIFILWVGSGFAIYFFFNNPTERGTFGDMFGAINAFFSGVAFLGIIYTLLLQRSEIEESKYQFRLNFLVSLISSQATHFNFSLSEYKFDINLDEIWTTPKLEDFNTSLHFFNSIKDSNEKMTVFTNKNGNRIVKTITFVSDNFDFIKSLLSKESLSDSDRSLLRKVYTRSINNNIIDLISLATIEMTTEGAESSNANSEHSHIHEEINKIKKNRITAILDFLDYKAF